MFDQIVVANRRFAFPFLNTIMCVPKSPLRYSTLVIFQKMKENIHNSPIFDSACVSQSVPINFLKHSNSNSSPIKLGKSPSEEELAEFLQNLMKYSKRGRTWKILLQTAATQSEPA